ncbi:MMPL family protein [Mycobacterium ulcerans str. Harvey]|uniref:MMPL family protein n=1 Tax=Mycobacterium ulcerans str. Harvey TaxID=1299332 RepID=A0ABN0R9C4_MYCUL|nr:MMPL family protein [Mycobacterium ulcerans str. Harvey]
MTRLRADTVHVQNVQDFWGDPLTEGSAQSLDGKAAYLQLYLSGTSATHWPTSRSGRCGRLWMRARRRPV